MKIYTLIALLCLMAAPAWASHLLGGQIQTQHVSGTTYSIRIQLFLDQAGGQTAFDMMSTIPVCMGDGTVKNIPRELQFFTANQTVSVNIYQFTHTYNGPGTYRITSSIPNRTPLINLTQAQESQFTLSTTILSAPNLQNSTPVFDLTSEFYLVATNQRTLLPFRMSDVEGDSLVYLLTKPLTTQLANPCAGASAINQYQFPNAVSQKGTYKLNARTGELVWDAPTIAGQYSAVVRVQEWRGGIQISESYTETFIRVQDKGGNNTPLPPYEPAADVLALVTGLDTATESDFALTISPNPVQGQLIARFQSNKATPVRFQLLDLSGRVVAEKVSMYSRTDHELILPVENLASGLYILQAVANERVVKRKVIKQ